MPNKWIVKDKASKNVEGCATVYYFKILSQYIPGMTKDNHERKQAMYLYLTLRSVRVTTVVT